MVEKKIGGLYKRVASVRSRTIDAKLQLYKVE